jgi:high-affinity iron transporter
MIAALIIVFREALEAGLIIGVVLAATRGVPRRGRWVALGVAGGVLGACAVAFFARDLAGLFHGAGQELFNASALLCAVAMLAWHVVWMASHAREMTQQLKRVGVEVTRGQRSLAAIAGVVAVAVLREGAEIVLFLYGVVTTEPGGWQPVALGGALGLLAGGLATGLIYFGLLAIPVRYFFSATAGLVTLLAAGLSAQAVSFLQQGGIVEHWSSPLWDTGSFISETGWVGKILHVLIGYTDQPTGMQLVAYAATLAAIFGLRATLNARAAGRSA